MAIQKTVIKEAYGQSISIPNAYHRVERIEGNKNNIIFDLATYDAEVINLVNVETFSFVPSDDENALRWDKQAYEYIKAKPEYLDAIDC